ncbi:hypothetical protein CALCODRAFT_522024 [Calocera cornea HHB12733]|uniref:CCHC-type domain-containing protein n=1 Tax=Calocera cornea HHB12733 TaxID=1353952 RepID=A0A165C6L5_9BASI|nr:hypothetical protein CALCODRAFT_522024 [Calocera cornea HHB12733]
MPALADDSADLALALHDMSMDTPESIDDLCFNCGGFGHPLHHCPHPLDPDYQDRNIMWFASYTAMRDMKPQVPKSALSLPERPAPRSLDDLRTPVPASTPQPSPTPPKAASPPLSLPANHVPTLKWTPPEPPSSQRCTPKQRIIANRVDFLAKIAKPACDDPKFKRYHISSPSQSLPARELEDLLSQQYMILITGVESWEGRPPTLEMLEEEGVIFDRERLYTFTSMDSLAQSMFKEARLPQDDELGKQNKPTPLHTYLTMPQFLARTPDDPDTLNCLECPYPAHGWPRHLRALFTRTVAHAMVVGGDATDPIIVERSELREQGWLVMAEDGSFTGVHQDAGNRATWGNQKQGDKVWFYFRLNALGEATLRDEALTLLLALMKYDEDQMRLYGTWHYVWLEPGTQLFQPSLMYHAVYSRADKGCKSIMAGMHADFPRCFPLMEVALKVEHIAGLAVTNAERYAWYSTPVQFASSLSPNGHEARSLPDNALDPLRNIITNPCAYVPERDIRTKTEYKEISQLYLCLHTIARHLELIESGSTIGEAAQTAMTEYTQKEKLHPFPPNFSHLLRLATRGCQNINTIMKARNLTPSKIQLASHTVKKPRGLK